MQMNGSRSNVPNQLDYLISLLGAGAANPTVNAGGQRMTASRIAVGRYLITWLDWPGHDFVGFGYGLRDNTAQANVKGWSVTAGVIVITNGLATMEVDTWNSTFVAADLATTSLADLIFSFRANNA